MKAAKARRRHAVRVAAVTTLIVVVCYVIAAVIINVLISNHLVATIDNRLHDRLQDADHLTFSLSGTPQERAEHVDVDDAPLFLWSVAPSGLATSLTSINPSLPARAWAPDTAETLKLGTSTFRFDTIRSGNDILVAGQSLSSTDNTRSTLLLAELVFGIILAVLVFIGATIIGLRASAPTETIRRRQAEFTADASHELRTPISVIEAEIDLALERPRDPTAYRHTLERVGRESARLRHIVEDLLWLARTDAPAPMESSELTDVAAVADECGQRFQALAAANGVTLSVATIGDGPYLVHAQPALIDRLAGVLVDNACKFAGDHGRVEVTVRNAGNRVLLRVDDSGPGIPEDEREAVVDRFHRSNHSVAGTGLGLSIADAVVQATRATWEIGTASLGGARLEISWRRATRKNRPGQAVQVSQHSALR